MMLTPPRPPPLVLALGGMLVPMLVLLLEVEAVVEVEAEVEMVVCGEGGLVSSWSLGSGESRSHSLPLTSKSASLD